jgi:hypothetical protein
VTAAGRAGWLAPLLLIAGCSLVLSRPAPPPGKDPDLYPDCDVPTGAIAGDIVVTLGAGALALGLASDDAAGAAVVSGLVGLAFGASAIRGIVVQDQCSRARAAHEARFNLQPLGPPVRPPAPVWPPPADGGADSGGGDQRRP